MINNGGKRAKNRHKIHVSLRISKKNGEKMVETLTEYMLYNYSTSDHLTKNTENSDSTNLHPRQALS